MAKIEFWKDKKNGLVDPKLFSVEADKLAREIASQHMGSKGKKENKRSQIRKFFDEVVRLDSLARKTPEKWDMIHPTVHMLSAKAAYARGRDLISEGFLEFIRESVKQVEEPKDLAVFANMFEAFMGFYRQHGPRS